MTVELLTLKVKLALAKLDFCESYRASNYLAEIIIYMISHEDDSKECCFEAVEEVKKKYSIAYSTILLGIDGAFKRSYTTKSCPPINRFYKKILFIKDKVSNIL